MKKPEALSEEEKTRKLADSAFYKRSKTPKSQMIMIKVLQANKLDNLRRTNKIAALAYFIQPDSKDLEIDYDRVKVLYSISNAFISTKKTAYITQGYWRYWIYPISWSFQLTQDTYTKYVLPWIIEDYHYHKILCSNYEIYLYRETRLSCPYCNKIMLTTKLTTKKDAIDQLKQKYKESFEEKKEALINEDEIRERNRYEIRLGYYHGYKPPHWEASYTKCPNCKEKIRLNFKFFKGTHPSLHPSIKPPEFETKEPVIEYREYYDPIVQVKRFSEASHVLTRKGYNQLVNSFLAWAEPSISRIEWEILKLVDPDTLQKYLDLEFKSEEKEEQGEEEQ